MADTTITLTDATGRKLEFKKLTMANTMDLYEAAGAANSENQQWMQLARFAAAVSSIDGTPCPFPRTKPQIIAAVNRVGDDGFQAIISHYRKLREDLEASLETTPDEQTVIAKN